MFYLCPLDDMTYVQAADQFVPNILEHHLVNDHYCIVMRSLSCWFWQFCIPTRRGISSLESWCSWVPETWTSGSLDWACWCRWAGLFFLAPRGHLTKRHVTSTSEAALRTASMYFHCQEHGSAEGTNHQCSIGHWRDDAPGLPSGHILSPNGQHIERL